MNLIAAPAIEPRPGDTTTIEWVVALARTKGMRAAVWNPQEGCSRAGPGCDNCWAAREVHMRGHQKGARVRARFGGLTTVTKDGAVAFNGVVREVESEALKPRGEKDATVYFVGSRSDLFHPKTGIDFQTRVIDVARAAPRHAYIFLTKRPLEMASMFIGTPAADNFLLGTTVCNQAEADAAQPIMAALADGGWRTWVSYEPALGPVNWTGWDFVKQIVFGGESGSGPNVRPAHPDWARATRDFCVPRRIAFFFKQWGEWVWLERGAADGLARWPDGQDRSVVGNLEPSFFRVGKKAAGAALDGREWNEVMT